MWKFKEQLLEKLPVCSLSQETYMYLIWKGEIQVALKTKINGCTV